jgi:ADP-heptose:LPS heptosyltransferase
LELLPVLTNTPPVDLPLPKPKWLIVVATDNARGASGTLWARLEAITKTRHDVLVVVVDSHEPDGDITAYAAVVGRTGFRYVSLPCSSVISEGFNLPRAYNVGASVFTDPPFLLFLHDDVDLPDDPQGGWLDRLGDALMTTGVGIAVPTLTGDCGNPVQGMALPGELEWVETTEFISPSCIAITRHNLRNAQGWCEGFSGYEWAQVYLQYIVASIGLSTVVVPPLDERNTFHHLGGGTYDRMAQDEAMTANGKLYAEKSGARWEYKMRPDRPRIAPDRWEDYGRDSEGRFTEDSLCFAVDSESGVKTALALISTESSYLDVVVVDTAPCKAHFDALRTTPEQDVFVDEYRNPRYFAAWDTDPVRQAIGSAASENVKVYDLRTGHALPVKPVEGKRLRIGAHYDLAARLTELHCGMVRDIGIGDTFMLTPALRAFKKAYPNCRTVVTHCWEAGEVLRHLPFLDEVNIAKTGDFHPLELFNAGEGSGSEGTIRQMFFNLGVGPASGSLDDPEWENIDRRLSYTFLPGEKAEAERVLTEGFPELPAAPVVIGIQLHGGWRSKSWSYTAAFVPRLLEEGYYVVLFGTEADRTPIVEPHERVMRLPKMSIREAVAVISLLDVMVTFDSGLGYAASAVGCAVVSLWGPHNPASLLMDTGAPNQVALRKMTPQMCHDKHGFSCRSGPTSKQTGGSSCPLRGEGEVGGDCIDAISPCNVLDEVLLIPKWGRSLRGRY